MKHAYGQINAMLSMLYYEHLDHVFTTSHTIKLPSRV